MYYTIYMRNNWSVDWTVVPGGSVEWEGTTEQLADVCKLTVQQSINALSETVTTNLYRMYSEVRIDEMDHNSDIFTRFHGFIYETTPGVTELQLHVMDFMGICNLIRCNVPASSATTIRLGTDAAPVKLILNVEDGENRYIPDPTIYDDAYIGGVPVGPGYTNRRTWKCVGGLRDSGTQDTDPEDPNYFPDHLIPPSYWSIGSDQLDYIEFIGYTPLGDISVDFLVLYVEGTNQLEDIILGAMSVALPHGPGLVAGVHYNDTSADYFTKTIWPSLITVNEWKWTESDGTLADMIDQLLTTYAPPNYRIWWDHEKLMLRLQYVELLPFDTTTSYYVAGSYPYGRIVTAPPDAETIDDYVSVVEIDASRTISRQSSLFKSKIITYGINEWPDNAITADMITTLEAYWPAGWTLDGVKESLIDRDFGTSCRVWWDFNDSPSAADRDGFYPTFHINFGEETSLERLRFWMLDSRRDFPFTFRVEAHNDPTYVAYDPNAPWEPMHPDLWDRTGKPFELIEVSNNFMKSICRCILITMRPAKIHLRFRYAAGFSDIEFIRSSTISGKAYVVGAAPGAGYTLISGAGATGSWWQKVGTKENDGEAVVLLPNLYNQLCSRSAIANKLVVGHRADVKDNRSLGNTNSCALESARILMETLRDTRKFEFISLSYAGVKKYRTVSVEDDLFGVIRNALVENLKSEQAGTVNITATAYGYSNANRAGAWTGETPNAL